MLPTFLHYDQGSVIVVTGKYNCRPSGAAVFGPKSKLSRRKSLLHQPESLAVIRKAFYGRFPAVAKNEQAAGKWIILQYRFADSGKSIDAVPEINRFHRHQDAHLRGDLDHRLHLQKLLLRAFRSGTSMPLICTRILAPFRVSNSMMHSGVSPDVAGLSSIKDGTDAPLTLPASRRFLRS
jgi:hypothetical protein